MSSARPSLPRAHRPSRIEVELEAIRHNVRRLAEVASTSVCAVVKGGGYGHGTVEVAGACLDAGAAWLGVALVEEGLELRAAGIQAPILVLAEPPVGAIDDLLHAELTPTVYRPAFVAALDRAGRERSRPVLAHVKVETGMGRVGIPPQELTAGLEQLARSRGVHVDGLCTHLARADEPAVATTTEQLAAFDHVAERFIDHGFRPRWRHTANTAGTLLHPRSRHDLVRPGIGVYGLSPAPDVDAVGHGLRPAMRLVTEVSFVKRIAAGTGVSYGHRWHAPQDGWLATLPIGYADGVPRALTNQAEVLHDGVRRPLVGTVCMDQVLLWFGDDRAEVGDEVVLLGAQGDDRVRVEEWAATADTITYEIVTQLTARLPRHHTG